MGARPLPIGRKLVLVLGAPAASFGLLVAAYVAPIAVVGVPLVFLAIALPVRTAVYLEGSPFWPKFLTRLGRLFR